MKTWFEKPHLYARVDNFFPIVQEWLTCVCESDDILDIVARARS